MTADGTESQGVDPWAGASASPIGEPTPDTTPAASAEATAEARRPDLDQEAAAVPAILPNQEAAALLAVPLASSEPGEPGPEPAAAGGGTGRRAPGAVAAVVGGLIILGAIALSIGTGSGATSAGGSPGPGSTDLAARTLGSASAPVTIEVWADYQCPFCRTLTTALEPSLERQFVHSGEAKIVFRDFAFLGPESVDAAVSARCAGRQNAFWLYHDLLYAFQQGENQGMFSAENLATIATLAGLDMPVYTACVADPAVRSDVLASTKAGSTLGITATPTLRFIGPAGTVGGAGVPGWPKVQQMMDQVTGRAPMPTPTPTPAPTTPAGSAPPTRAPASGGTPAGSPAAGAPTIVPSSGP